MNNFYLVSNRIFNSAVILFFGKIIQLLLLFTAAREMGVSEFGVFSIVLAFSQFSTFFLVPGGQQGLTKIVTRLFSTKKFEELGGVILSTLIFFILIIILIILLNLSFKYFNLFQQKNVFLMLTILIPITLWTVIREGISRGFSFIGISQIPHELIAPLLILSFVFFDLSYYSSAYNFLLLWVSCFAFIELILLTFVFLKFMRFLRAIKFKFEFHNWFNELIPIQISNLTKAGVLRTDVIATGILLGAAEAGLYSIAQKLAQPITLIARTIFAATGYLISRFYELKEYDKLYHSVWLSTLFAFIGSVFYIILVLMTGELIISAISSEYLSAFPILIILSIALFFDSVASPSSQFLLICGYPKTLILFNSGGFLIYIIFLFASANITSGISIAFSVLISLFLINFACMFLSYRVLMNITQTKNA